MAKTISNTITTGYTLTSGSDPLSITSSGAVTAGAGSQAAIFGNASQAWTVDNDGLVSSAGAFAIEFQAGGMVTNTGTIADSAQSKTAILIGGAAGSLSNTGSVLGGGNGVLLAAGGTIYNAGGITGTTVDGVSIYGGAGTVTNAGTITGKRAAVKFAGSYDDRVIIDPGAVFDGIVQGGSGTNTLELAAGTAGATGTLSNFADEFVGFGIIAIDSGASWQFDSSDTIGSGILLTVAGTLSNAGSIASAVQVLAGGIVSNSGTINTSAGGGNAVTSGDVTNTGRIYGGSFGVLVTRDGTVNNSGIISAKFLDGVYAGVNSTVTNLGTIEGPNNGISIVSGAVYNFGLISAPEGNFFDAGVNFIVGAGTLTNGGTISGNVNAVYFQGDNNDRLIIDPGAVFNGLVLGGSGTNTLELAAGTSGATGTLSGFASEFLKFGTIAIDAGASWQFDSSDTIASGITLTDAGTLSNAGSIATTVNVINGGVVSNTGTIIKKPFAQGGYGVYSAGAATVTNTGFIFGGVIGIFLGTGKVINDGSISGIVGVQVDGNATVTNSGTISGDIGLAMDSGSVYNSGVISTSGFGNPPDPAITFSGAGTLTNAGTLHGEEYAVRFQGSFADRVIIDPGAVFDGIVQGGSDTNTLELAAGTAGATGTLSSFATQFVNFGTIIVDSGAVWDIDGVLTGTLNNEGLVDSTVTMAGGGSVLNSGTIDAGSGSYGVTLQAGGTVTNIGAGALIEGSRYGIRAAGAAAYVTNGGTILGTAGLNGGGVALYAGGTVTNTGDIDGVGGAGVYITGGAGTVIDAGTIGGSFDAVEFSGSAADRVIIDPGAVFDGIVQGGSGTNTLELAAGTSGATGTLSSFASEFVKFGTIAIDAGASWQFDSSDTIASGVRLTDAGTLSNAGSIATSVTVDNGGVLSNAGTIIKKPILPGGYGVYSAGAATVTNTGFILGGVIGIDLRTGTVINHGSISATFIADVYIENGGVLINTGDFYSRTVGASFGSNATVTNSGTIVGRYSGVAMGNGGSIYNTGVISGGSGDGVHAAVGFYAGTGTLTNSGTLDGAEYAVRFQGSFADRLIMDPGSVIEGQVVGGTGTNTLELAAGTAGAIGTLTGFPSDFTNFNTLTIDSGAKWQFDATDTIAAGVIFTDQGVYLGNAGTIDQTVLLSAQGSFVNTGTVDAGGGAKYGVTLQAGGVVTNAGIITATTSGKAEAVRIDGAAGTVTNTGTLLGGADGVALTGGGTVFNSGSIGGAGAHGVYIGGGGTLTNAGTISGGIDAVLFTGNEADRVIVDPGAVFNGLVHGGSGTNTLELAAGTAGATGTLSGFGTEFTSFGTIIVDSGAKWELDGASPASHQSVTLAGAGDVLALGAPAHFADAIDGFAYGDKLDLTGLAWSSGATATFSGNTLTVTSGSTTDTFTLNGLAFDTNFRAIDDGTPSHGTLVEEAACYCRGTRILTDRGEVPVEDLAIGDRLITASGKPRPIKWIGQRSYAGWLAAGNAKVWPICLAPGSLADGVPARALRVSPEHAIWLDGALVPAGLLVNGSSIRQSAPPDEVHYYHVELDTHDIILAEGAPAESFVDDGSRGMFHNAAEFHARYPDERRAPATFCAPRLVDGFALDALQQRLAARGRRLRPDGRAATSRLRGYVERVTREGVLGWAFDPEAPDTRVAVGVFDNGVAIGQAVADLPRGDLARAGIGDGRHGFFFAVPGGFNNDVRHEIEVRSADGVRLAAHAGVSVLEMQAAPQTVPALGRLRGKLDLADRRRITGWAQDAVDPERRVGLLVTANGTAVGRVLANLYRGDLEAAGRGSGRHSFAFALPAGLASDETVQIRVLREADGAELPGSPFDLPAVSEADEADALKRLVDETQAMLARRAARAVGEARDPGGPRALVIDLQTPDPARDGGSAAILSHMRALTSLGYAVGFAPADGRLGSAAAALLATQGISAYAAPYYAGVESVLRTHAGAFDLIYLHRHDCADRYLALARAHHPKARIVYSVADLHHVRLARQAQVQGRPDLLAYSRRVASAEAYAASRADVVLTHSPAEAQLLRQVAGFGRVHVVPFAAAARPGTRGFAERHGLAFIGSFGHAPNADAVYVLARDIMPLVWAQDPSITCRIAGHGWQPGRLPGLDPRMQILGQTDDLDGLLDSVRLTVAPMRFGAGIKAKVLDSFAAAVPCVMTRIAAEGLALADPLSIPIADDAATIAGHILRLHADEPLNARIGAAASRWVADAFDQSCIITALGEALDVVPQQVKKGLLFLKKEAKNF